MWSTFFFYFTIAVYSVLIISTVTVVLLENRQPAKTIAWTVVLVMLPVVGLVAFYFFGQNVRKERHLVKRQYSYLTHRLLSALQGVPRETPPARYAPLIQLFEKSNSSVLAATMGVEGYKTGADWLTALLREIAKARSTVHIETYIIADDPVGRLLRDALIDAAQRGVHVRLLYDDVGSWDAKQRFFRPMEEAGVEVAPFLPVRFPRLTHKVNYRNHRKICVIDSSVGFIGGMNFALRYVSRRMRPWCDLHLRLEGAGVADMQRLFLSDWYFVTEDDYVVKHTPLVCAPENAAEILNAREDKSLLQIVPSSPISHFPEIMYGLTWVIQHARRYLYIQTPYFMPTEPVLQAMQTAAMSGVDVRLMLPMRPDGFWLRWVNDSYFSNVLEAGVRVFRYKHGFLHSKCAVADDDWCTVGSSNMDFRSFENNFEANAFIYGETAAVAMRRNFEEDLEACEEVTFEAWNKRPYRRRFLESCTRILAPLL